MNIAIRHHLIAVAIVFAMAATVASAEPQPAASRAGGGTVNVKFRLVTKPGGETFMSVGDVTNYDYNYELYVVQDADVAEDGTFTLSESRSLGHWEVHSKVRSKEGREGWGKTAAAGFCRGSGKFAEDGTLTLKLELGAGPGQGTGNTGDVYSYGKSTRYISSEWVLPRPSPEDDVQNDPARFVQTYRGLRSTSVNQAPAAPPLPVEERVRVEYTRKKGADLVVTCSVIPTTERHNSQATFNVRVTNKGPDKCPVASIDLWARLFDNEAVADLTTGRRDPRPGHGFRMVSEFANHSRLGRLPLGGGSLEAGVLYYQWPNFEKDDDVVAITIIVRHVAPRGMTGSGTVFLQGNVTGSITDPSLENNEIQGDGSYADFYDPRIDAR